ncbi:MAG: hypothetical protein JO101_08080 [Candidatus Eremiobacteraeota bacterium]|nr:hypothetical protein [Candidatus Eremiobacteraeota bacterium]MBV8355261.1 hypothetical protein [Candidatus Eremiobacteraeota bacterium]
MQSSPGSSDPGLRPTAWLAGAFLLPLLIALLLAFEATPGAPGSEKPPTVAVTLAPIAAPAPVLPIPGPPTTLWDLLAPWAYRIDALALGMTLIVLFVRARAQRRRELRT